MGGEDYRATDVYSTHHRNWSMHWPGLEQSAARPDYFSTLSDGTPGPPAVESPVAGERRAGASPMSPQAAVR